MKDYLTEESLGEFLCNNFRGGYWIHDSCFKGRYRPDYRNESYNTIVEFDGFQHYTSSKVIINDMKKDKLYSGLGYKIIRIPYFIQLSRETICNLFGQDLDYKQTYNHGFIDKKCVLPADFCELGIERFVNDIDNKFPYLKNEIIKSLNDKIISMKNIDLVIPKSLRYLLTQEY